jgi:glycosyltransferase involved in cell wall biosynthesis
MRLGVVLSTYNQPAWLEKTLRGYACQDLEDFELIIADDGSGEETFKVIEAARSKLNIVHVWHEDDGFRKCEILNRSIMASESDYLVFSDGDMVPRRDFLSAHARLAEEGRFLSGGAIRLPLETSQAITLEDIESGRFMEAHWLRARGWKKALGNVRFTTSEAVAKTFDRLTTTRPTWNGGNSSTWKRHLIEINGFDNDMKYGGEDRALGERLENLGLKAKQIRYRAVLVHLEHGRPYVTEEAWKYNDAVRKRIAKNKEIRARNGIAELPDEPVMITR